MPACRTRMLLASAVVFVCLASSAARAVDVTIDYSYDTSDFFGPGNPDGAAAGAQAKASMDAAATFYTDLLEDVFSAITVPPPLVSTAADGIYTWTWDLAFSNPSSGASVTLTDEIFAANEYRVYVGARSLGSNELGIGGIGGFGFSTGSNGGLFSFDEIDQINTTNTAFIDSIENRGQASGFSRWGGQITFDNDSSTDWHYDHTTSPSSGLSDFYSVAVHELGHALGLGVSDNWDNWVAGTNYNGPAAVAEFGGLVPLDCDINGCGHWAEGTNSTVYGTTIAQETALDPTLTAGTRKLLTTLDAAAMTDIGWTVASPPPPDPDLDLDGDIDFADAMIWQRDGAELGWLAAWRAAFGSTAPIGAVTVPEPSGWALLIALAAQLGLGRRRQLA